MGYPIFPYVCCIVLLTLTACKSECQVARERAVREFDYHSSGKRDALQQAINACGSDDQELARMGVQLEQEEAKRTSAKQELQATVEHTQQLIREGARMELDAFLKFATSQRDQPGKGLERRECYSGDDPDAGFCEAAWTTKNHIMTAKWWREDKSALRIDSSGLSRVPFACTDLHPSAIVVRKWRWDLGQVGEKIQTRCQINEGTFAGFEALIQYAPFNTYVSLFSVNYLQRHKHLLHTLLTQGTTL